METSSIRNYTTEAIQYWEPRRIIYNVVLAVVVVFYFSSGLPASKHVVTRDSMLLLFLLAVLANVAYCAAYLVDIFVQMSGYREPWRTKRWVLFVVGLAVATVLTRFVSLGFFASQSH
jgi:hypothetical protein